MYSFKSLYAEYGIGGVTLSSENSKNFYSWYIDSRNFYQSDHATPDTSYYQKIQTSIYIFTLTYTVAHKVGIFLFYPNLWNYF